MTSKQDTETTLHHSDIYASETPLYSVNMLELKGQQHRLFLFLSHGALYQILKSTVVQTKDVIFVLERNLLLAPISHH